MTFYDDQPRQAGRVGYVVVRSTKPDHYTVHRNCSFCGEGSSVLVPSQGLWDWEHGTFVQDAFPELTAFQREVLLTGTHEECWKRVSLPEETCPDCGELSVIPDPSVDGLVCAECGWTQWA